MKCPVCRSESFLEWGTAGKYSVLRCADCRLGITHPFPDIGDMESFNRETYPVEKMVEVYLSRKSYFKRRYKKYIADIMKFNGPGKLLDVGCNIGMFLRVACDSGFDGTGVELNRQCAEYGRVQLKLNIYSDDLEYLRFPNGFFDVITLFDVLEHVPDPMKFLNEVNRILKDRGLLVIQSPNLDSFMAYLGKTRWAWLSLPDHLYHFSPEVLKKLLEGNGFRVRKLTTWEPPLDFCTDLFSTCKPQNILGKVGLKFTKGTIYVIIKATFINRLWWKRNKGGLILSYSSKTSSPVSHSSAP